MEEKYVESYREISFLLDRKDISLYGSTLVSGPFCMIIGLVAARYRSNNNPYAIVSGMVIGRDILGIFVCLGFGGSVEKTQCSVGII